MLKEERLQRLLQILDEQGSVTAEQLSQSLYVSLPTVYRDLRELQRRSEVTVGSGGAGSGPSPRRWISAAASTRRRRRPSPKPP